MVVRPQVFEMYAQTWHGFFLGLLAFFFGFLFLYSGKAFWQTILKWRWLYLRLAVTLYIIRLKVFELKLPSYIMAIESNCSIFAVFGFAYKYLNKPSKTLAYLSKAAYPVYIIHMFVLYEGGLFILPWQIHPWLKFTGITLFTFVMCYLIYEYLLRRTPVLRPLFGLKWKFIKGEKQISIFKN